jgi:hypothetical protein
MGYRVDEYRRRPSGFLADEIAGRAYQRPLLI